jgi:glycosyltransferase involved in cell wall biosynthesis
MRIAHVAPRGEGPGSGVLTALVELAAALARRGHSVDLWKLHHWESDAYRSKIDLLERDGVEAIPVSGTPLWKLALDSRRVTRARSRELIHLHGAFNPSNTVLSRVLPVPYVFSPHSGYDSVSLLRSRRRKRLFSALFEHGTVRRASLVGALTEVEREQVQAFGSAQRIVVTPNGVTSPPPRGLDGAVFRRELQLAASVPLALFVGRMDIEHKGLDLFLRGISESDRWHAALVGPDHRGGRTRLSSMAAMLGIEERVHLCSVRRDAALDEAFYGADVFVLMSRWEGMPMSLLESLAHGTPAVVSPTVERLVAVERAGAGWISSAGQLGKLLNRLCEVRAELMAAGRAALELARAYDWDRIAERYEAAYATVVR